MMKDGFDATLPSWFLSPGGAALYRSRRNKQYAQSELYGKNIGAIKFRNQKQI